VDIWQHMQETLDGLAARHLLRRPVTVESTAGSRVTINGREVVCFCSNDYLGLAGDERLRSAAAAAIEQWGVGAGASRLVSGTTRLHVQLEQRLAEFKRTEAAVVTSTGWMANHAALHALAGKGDLVLCDKLDHASILDAAQGCGGKLRIYRHRDMARLTELLDRHRGRYRHCVIVTDSLFSMTGDLAPLAELVDIKKRYDAVLMIDEAHATGVLGSSGRGAAELLAVEDDVDVVVGTLSKALGSLGGFVAGRQVLIDAIRNTGRAYVYTTAPPAAICAAAMAAMDIVRDEPDRRRRLLAMAEALRAALRDVGMDTCGSVSQIVPVLIGRADAALAAARRLVEAGIFVAAIRPPTVPKGTSRLRISLSAGHTQEDVRRLTESIARLEVRD